MSYYPVSLDLNGRICVVIGGGKVAERKVHALLSCGAKVQVVSPELSSILAALYKDNQLTWISRDYQEDDLDHAFLVIAATDDTEVQRRTYEEAKQRGILINVVDVPQKCNFILPATVRRGNFTVSVSTGGKSPALAKKLRVELEKRFGPEYKIIVDILGALRQEVLAAGRSQIENEALFNRLIHDDMQVWVRDQDWRKIDDHIKAVLGDTVETNWLKQAQDS